MIGHHLPLSSAEPRRPRFSPGMEDRSDRSVPAQKAPPVPFRTTTSASSSSPARANAAIKSLSIAKLIAFFFSGRFIVMVQTASATSYKIHSLIINSIHLLVLRHRALQPQRQRPETLSHWLAVTGEPTCCGPHRACLPCSWVYQSYPA